MPVMTRDETPAPVENPLPGLRRRRTVVAAVLPLALAGGGVAAVEFPHRDGAAAEPGARIGVIAPRATAGWM